MARTRRVYYIPRYREKTGGQADSWVKLYRKDLLLSQAYKQLTLSEKGVWFHLFLLANRDGELRSGHLIYSDKQLAKELKTPLRTWNRIRMRLLSGSIGLLATRSIQLSNNCPTIVKPNGLKSTPAGQTEEETPPGVRLQNRLDKNRVEKEKKKKRKEKHIFSKSSSKKTKPGEKQFYKNGTRIEALSKRYGGIKPGEIGMVQGTTVHFPRTGVHQEQVRENPYDWKIVQ